MAMLCHIILLILLDTEDNNKPDQPTRDTGTAVDQQACIFRACNA